jgi:hypothetical protein
MLDKQGYTYTRAQAPMHTRTHTYKCVIHIGFPQQQQFVNAPQYYVIHTLPVVLFVKVYCLYKI